MLGSFHQRALACPFCEATQPTLSEEVAQSQVACLAEILPTKLSSEPTIEPEAEEGQLEQLSADQEEDFPGRRTFRVLEILKGDGKIKVGDELQLLFLYEVEPKSKFLLVAKKEQIAGEFIPSASPNAGESEEQTTAESDPSEETSEPTEDPEKVGGYWWEPVALGAGGAEYIQKVMQLKVEGSKRLSFFLEYLEDPNTLIANDAYNEFAITSYEDLKGLKGELDANFLVERVKDSKTRSALRRLYCTMLGVCGSEEQVPALEDLLKNPEQDKTLRLTLDALIACYLTLKGEGGLELIEKHYLSAEEASYLQTYSAVMALRFHGEMKETIPRDRLAKTLTALLEQPEYADLVVPDLARWEYWEVLPKLVELFRLENDQADWLRPVIINFLRVCPLPKAKTALAELKEMDPEAYDRSLFQMPFIASADENQTEEASENSAAAETKEALEVDNQMAANSAPETTSEEAPQDETIPVLETEPLTEGETIVGEDESESDSESEKLSVEERTQVEEITLAAGDLSAETPLTSEARPSLTSSPGGRPKLQKNPLDWLDWKLWGMVACVLALVVIRWKLRRGAASLRSYPVKEEKN
ncbi:Hypothetical protein PBC10988_0420 [Planctomycetales bacterium 10988]|nr:Hypothetical protein PBC10988_0420 [Planctomycetales bacterium 10988]